MRDVLDDLPSLDPTDAFTRLRELPDLTMLELCGSGWRSIPAVAGELPSLRVLRFRSCWRIDVRSVCAAFSRTETLRSLSFESTARRYVTRVPAEIGNMTSLDELLIAGASSVPAQLGRLARLETLRLAGSFQKIPEQLGGLVGLRRLAISAVRLHSLPRAIGKLAALEELDVHAPIAELPDEIGELAALRSLDVRATRVKVLPATIDRLALHTLRVPPGVPT